MELDPRTQYYITPASEPGKYISVNGGMLTLEDFATALSFIITISPNDSAAVNICTTYQSSKYCLDQWGKNVTQGALQRADYVAGQQWTLTGTEPSDGNNFSRLQSEYAGPSRYLASDGLNVVLVANAPLSDTYWEFLDVNQTSTSSSSTASAGTSTSLTTATTAVATPTFSPTLPQAQSFSLPSGAVASIIVGAVVVVIFVALLGFTFRRKRRQRTSHSRTVNTMQPVHQVSADERPKPALHTQVFEVPGDMQRDPLVCGPGGVHEIDSDRRYQELGSGRTL